MGKLLSDHVENSHNLFLWTKTYFHIGSSRAKFENCCEEQPYFMEYGRNWINLTRFDIKHTMLLRFIYYYFEDFFSVASPSLQPVVDRQNFVY